MGQRLDLQDLLETLANNVYFQPPPSTTMSYPCIVYSRTNIIPKFADNTVYGDEKRYTIIVIDPDPDSLIPDQVALLPRCRFDRHYVSDNLNHDAFNIIF